MSGGAWGYKQFQIEELTQAFDERRNEIVELLKAAAESEHIVDWAECGDTARKDTEYGPGAESKLYDLWLKTFEKLYG